VLQFVSLNTEQNVDFVEVWVGGRSLATSTLLRRLSGNSASGLLLSDNHLAIVRFLSDGSYQDAGFQLTWQSGKRFLFCLHTCSKNDVLNDENLSNPKKYAVSLA
jgi:hypothetical protein